MVAKTLQLHDSSIPLVGFGTYLISNDDIEAVILDALKAGYRHIDTAQGYFNEEGIGSAIEKACTDNMLSREDLFITTKLWPGNEQWGDTIKNYEMTLKACEESLEKLRIDHIDLYLIHAPFAKDLRLEQWRALIQLKESGKVTEIGVCNYNQQHLEEIGNAGLVLPAINQIELHPWSQKHDLLEYMSAKSIQPMAYSSLVPLATWRESPGQDSAKSEQMKKDGNKTDSVFKKLSAKYEVSEAQILLKWAVQQNIPVIPKSVNPERMSENIDVFSFSIADEDMQLLSTLDRGDGVAWPGADPIRFEQ